MKKGKLQIILKSDLCVSDGGVYNSLLDTDICYDKYGFPFIPGKRIRGCLRESALELLDWGACINPDTLFGKEGDSPSSVKVGDAVLEEYDSLIQSVKGVNNMLFHPQNILNYYSYVRTQTAIDYDTGVADDTSLRTMRVAKKGLVFEAPVEYEEEIEKNLERCANILRHMGIARTRGFGEVEVKLKQSEIPAYNQRKHSDLREGANRLDYTVTLVDPVIFKSQSGGEAKTLDYIEGSRILGLIAQSLKDNQDNYEDFINDGNLFVSNAYISRNGLRYTEVPATYYRIKNNTTEYRDKLYDSEEHRVADKDLQLNPMKHGYAICDKNMLDCIRVAVEERYHHRRPKDKSIGRADTRDPDSVFYQMSSICKNQSFMGYITGSEAQIKKAYECLTEHDLYRIGTGRTSEYGRVEIHVDKTSKQGSVRSIVTSEFAVKLISPAIVYSEQAFYSVSSQELIDEILLAVNLKKESVNVRKYIRYVTVGGYNVTWQKRKPSIQAFDKGTVILIHTSKPVELHIPEVLFIGERTTEGYGEIEIIEIEKDKELYFGKLKKDTEVSSKTEIDVTKSHFSESIAKDQFLRYLRSDAAERAAYYFKKSDTEKKATVSDLTMMCNEFTKKRRDGLIEGSVIEAVSEESENRYATEDDRKKKKSRFSKEILEKVSGRCVAITDEFTSEYCLQGFEYDRAELESEYLLAFLTFGKYIMHKNEKHKKNEGDVK